MIYIVYKNPEDRVKYENYFNKINNLLYQGHDKILSKFHNKVKYVNYDSINNKELLNELDSSEDYMCDINDNSYVMTYSEYIYLKYDVIKDLVTIYTTIIAGDDKNNCFESYCSDNNSLSIAYNKFDCLVEDAINNDRNIQGINDDLVNFTLLAFSNRVDVTKDNDLIKGYLFDRNSLKDNYEKVMGDNSFNDLIKYSDAISFNKYHGTIPKYEYFKVLDNLKKYFYIKMSQKNDISINEKNSMIINFNTLYSKLKTNYLNKKRTF